MTLRSRHGNARKHGIGPVIEVLPVDELPQGMPDPSKSVQAPRRRGRRFEAADPHTIAAARAGGRSRAGRTLLAATLAVKSDDPTWRTLLGQAETFRRAQVRELRDNVGGGKCGPAPSSCVASAALALAGSRLEYARGNFDQASRLAVESRQHLLAAQELCAREARPSKQTPLAALRARAASTHVPPKKDPTE
jgi:hypothetical protein